MGGQKRPHGGGDAKDKDPVTGGRGWGSEGREFQAGNNSAETVRQGELGKCHLHRELCPFFPGPLPQLSLHFYRLRGHEDKSHLVALTLGQHRPVLGQEMDTEAQTWLAPDHTARSWSLNTGPPDP